MFRSLKQNEQLYSCLSLPDNSQAIPRHFSKWSNTCFMGMGWLKKKINSATVVDWTQTTVLVSTQTNNYVTATVKYTGDTWLCVEEEIIFVTRSYSCGKVRVKSLKHHIYGCCNICNCSNLCIQGKIVRDGQKIKYLVLYIS